MRAHELGRLLFVPVALAAAGCSGGNGAVSIHELAPAKGDFYALPFPNDLRLDADGTVALGDYYHPAGALGGYVDAVDQRLRGFGTGGAVYFRFDRALDPASLPDAGGSLNAGASAFVVDVMPGSPTYGQRTPVIAHFVAEKYDFIGANWVALLPVPGFPLRGKTTYAAVLTSKVHDVDGQPLRGAPVLRQALTPGAAMSSDPTLARAGAAYAPLTSWLATQPGLADLVVNATVFTTTDPTSIMAKLRQSVYAHAPAPTLDALTDGGEDQAGVDHIYTGTFQSPNFQAGEPPYSTSGGAIELGDDGLPKIQRTETLRVAITVPVGTMPAAGWPVVLYAHGTGGDYQSFINDGSGASAARVAHAAMISIDQVLHGPRDPTAGNVELNFFNFQNIVAGRDNPKQGAADDYQLLRLVKAIDVAAPPGGGARFKFDPTRIYFKGHSQGGLTGPLFLSAEPEISAAVLSGAGGGLIFTLLHKTEPVNIPNVISALLRDPLDEFHPLLNLMQGFFDDADPANYGRLFFREPPAGMSPKSIFQTLGLVDHYTPLPNIKALALAIGVQPTGPELEHIDYLELAQLSWTQPVLKGNVAGGAATGALLEYQAPQGSDGHFVVFDVAAAVAQSNLFLAAQSTDGLARVEAP